MTWTFTYHWFRPVIIYSYCRSDNLIATDIWTEHAIDETYDYRKNYQNTALLDILQGEYLFVVLSKIQSEGA